MLAGESPLGTSESLLQRNSTKSLPAGDVKDSGLRNLRDKEALNKSIVQEPHRVKKKKKQSETQFTSVLKFFNIIIGVMVLGFSAFCYYGANNDETLSEGTLAFVKLILPGYIAFSGLIILSIECHIGFMVRNMKFLYNYFGRGFFNIYVGVMPLTLLRQGKDSSGKEQDIIFQIMIYVVVSLMCFIGILYIFAKVFCCAQEGDKRKKKRNQSSDDSSDQSQ